MLDVKQVADEEVQVAIAALRVAADLGHAAARHALKVLTAEDRRNERQQMADRLAAAFDDEDHPRRGRPPIDDVDRLAAVVRIGKRGAAPTVARGSRAIAQRLNRKLREIRS